jgi:hypothetical protein
LFEAFGETQQVRHEIKGSSAYSVKADKPLHLGLPAPGVFHVVNGVLCNKGIAQSPLRPVWFDPGFCTLAAGCDD